MGVHSPTPTGSRVKCTQVPSAAGHEGSPPPATARQSRRQALFTHTDPPLHLSADEHVSVTPFVPSAKQAAAPVGSAIWQVVPGRIDAHEVGASVSQLSIGKQTNAPVLTVCVGSLTSSARRQCSVAGHPVQSLPQHNLRQ